MLSLSLCCTLRNKQDFCLKAIRGVNALHESCSLCTSLSPACVFKAVECQALSTCHHGWEEVVWWWRWAIPGGSSPSSHRCFWNRESRWLDHWFDNRLTAWDGYLLFFCIAGACSRSRQRRETWYAIIFLLFLAQFCTPGPRFLLLMEVLNLHIATSVTFSVTAGGLVKKILETKKDYELTPSSPKSKDQVGTRKNLVILAFSTRG